MPFLIVRQKHTPWTKSCSCLVVVPLQSWTLCISLWVEVFVVECKLGGGNISTHSFGCVSALSQVSLWGDAHLHAASGNKWINHNTGGSRSFGMSSCATWKYSSRLTCWEYKWYRGNDLLAYWAGQLPSVSRIKSVSFLLPFSRYRVTLPMGLTTGVSSNDPLDWSEEPRLMHFHVPPSLEGEKSYN